MTVAIPADPLYIAARRVLLNALDALHNHRDGVILVGAQAIYLQAGDADLEVSVAPYTADVDLSQIGGNPRIIDAMRFGCSYDRRGQTRSRPRTLRRASS